MGIHSQKNSPNNSSKPKLKDFLVHESRYGSSSNRQPRRVSEYEEILSLISYCSQTYTNNDPSEAFVEQDLKRQKLIRLLSFIKSLRKLIPDQILPPLFTMISRNLLRPLPPQGSSTVCILPDDDDFIATPTPAWRHLQIIYDILLRLVHNSEAKSLRDYIDHRFILSLLALSQSEDPRERESLKNVYHKIYAKFHSSRSFMRRAMRDVLLHYIFETEQKHCGIGDLLEICGTIINGFSVPLKEEHKLFLKRVLIPLHRPTGMQVYHKQLAYCIYQFVEKEPTLGVDVVRGVLKYWPVTNCPKEVLLIGELEELVEIMGPEQYTILALPLCTQIIKCLNSWNSQVAERALYVWNNEEFVKMTAQAIDEVFPVVVEGMENNLKMHWSKSVRQLTENVKEMLVEMEPNVYYKCLSEYHRNEFVTKEEAIRRKERWEKVEIVARKNQLIQEQNDKT